MTSEARAEAWRATLPPAERQVVDLMNRATVLLDELDPGGLWKSDPERGLLFLGTVMARARRRARKGEGVVIVQGETAPETPGDGRPSPALPKPLRRPRGRRCRTGGDTRARSFLSQVPTRAEYEANVLSLRRELSTRESEPAGIPAPLPPNGFQVAARLGLSVPEWSRARGTFPSGATWRDIRKELRPRIQAREPTGISTVKTLEDIPAI